MKACLGLITVGQAPRVDITPYMAEILGPGVELIEKGALDGLSPEELDKLAPTGNESILASRLKDGSEVIMSHKKVMPLVQQRIDELNAEGVNLILLLCTGIFPKFNSEVLILESQKIVDHFLEAVVQPDQALGLFVPKQEQEHSGGDKLAHITSKVVTACASPYDRDGRSSLDQFKQAARNMMDRKPDLIVLHCMGYNQTHRQLLADICSIPIVVANSIVARTVAELLPC